MSKNLFSQVDLEPFHPQQAMRYNFKDELSTSKIYSLGDSRLHFESITFDEKGRLFGSYTDGIYEIDLGKNTATEFVYTGLSPGFLISDGNGKLLVGDFMQGLLEIDLATKEIKPLLKKVDGVPLKFTETIAVSKNGEDIYLTDGAQQGLIFDNNGNLQPIASSLLAGLQARFDGRLIHYNRRTKIAKTLVQGFIFANGIALDENETSVLVADTFTNNVTRVWIKGPKSGQTETILVGLPCTPDNMRAADKLGGFFLACVTPRSGLLDTIQPFPLLKRVISWIPIPLLPLPPKFSACIHFDYDGTLKKIYSDTTGNVYGSTTCLERDGTLYMSGLEFPGVAAFEVPSSTRNEL